MAFVYSAVAVVIFKVTSLFSWIVTDALKNLSVSTQTSPRTTFILARIKSLINDIITVVVSSVARFFFARKTRRMSQASLVAGYLLSTDSTIFKLTLKIPDELSASTWRTLPLSYTFTL